MSTADQRRARATQDRIRAVYRAPKSRDGLAWYQVYNLSTGARYKVYQGRDVGGWRCTCPATGACKHWQRVVDREEARTKREYLNSEREQDTCD